MTEQIVSTFTIDIRGHPLDVKSGALLKERCGLLVRRVDKNAVLEEKHFASVADIYIWRGTPINFRYAQGLLKFIDVSLGKYFDSWMVTVDIDLKERG